MLYCVADPTYTGGGLCFENEDCGPEGFCVYVNNSAYCVCTERYGDPHCFYERKSRTLAGTLQIIFTLVFIGGIGNFILDHRILGGGQLAMTIMIYWLPVGILIAMRSGKNLRSVEFLVFVVLLLFIALVGFTWSIIDGVSISQGRIPDSMGYHTY